MSACTPFGDDLWLVDGPDITMLTIPFTTRMVVARLPDGGLWLHSPVEATDERVAAVLELGTPTHLVAPNPFHNLFITGWQERFPEATTWAGPGLAKRRPQLRIDGQLTDGPSPWEGIEQVVMRGSFLLEEIVFLHRPSRTVIFTDTFQNHDPAEDGLFWRSVKRLVGIEGPEGGAPRDWRLTITDIEATRHSVRRILAWDFERVTTAHGLCVPEDGHARIATAFAWLRV